MTDSQIQVLIDRNDIIDTLTRYGTGIDQKNEAVYGSCFTDELEVDIGAGFTTMARQQWVEQAMKAVGPFQVTQHIITNHTITIDGDEATCVAYLQAQHWNPGNYMLVGGHYTDRLVRTPDGWRIASLKLTITWSQTG